MANAIKTAVAAGLPQTRSVDGPPDKGAVWWRQPMVWLVIAGPLAVVVAGFWTLGIALSHVDPVVADTPVSTAPTGHANVPAQAARNHAATSRAAP